MKAPLRLSIGILVLRTFVAGQAVGQPWVSPDMARIVKRGKLVVAVVMKDEYPVHLLSWLNLYLKTDRSGTTIDGILNRYPRK